jgi:phosphohistidine phosphatase
MLYFTSRNYVISGELSHHLLVIARFLELSMKKLLLMRHAKSSFKDNDIQDFERPLSKRGEKDAPRMGKLLKEKDLVPDLILSSAAIRAGRTAEIVAEKCGYKREIIYVNDFYLGEPDIYIQTLRDLKEEEDNEWKTLLVIGHNPGLESLLQQLADKVESLPTSAIAYLQVPVRTWKAINADVIAKVEAIWRPRDLK